MSIRFEEISLTNFMPFYGRHSIDLGGGRPVTIVYGENMWGKTSILNALRWVWYGSALDRLKSPILRRRLVNWDAAEEANCFVLVELDFLVDTEQFRLSRKIQPKYPNSVPERDLDFEELLYMTRNDRSIKASDIQPLLNSLMPLRVSEFSLFDGEQLDEYEQLLLDPNSQRTFIRDSIEHILGVPAMTNAINDLRTNLKDAAKRQRGLASKDRAARGHVDIAERTEAAVEQAERDIRELSGVRDECNREVLGLDKALRLTAGIESESQRLHDLQSSIRQFRDDIVKLEQERKSLLARAWADLVDPMVSRMMEELRQEQQTHMTDVQRIGELHSQIEQIDSLLATRLCPFCRQAPPVGIIEDTDRKRGDLMVELQSLHIDQDRLTHLADAIRKLSRIKPVGVAVAVNRIEEDLRRANVSLVGSENKKDDIEKKLEGHDQASVVQNRSRYSELLKRLGSVEGDIKEKGAYLNRLRADGATYRAKIGQAAGPQLNRLNHELAIYDSLISIFEAAIVRLVDQLKIDVERDATEIFLKLTTDREYTRLRINERYGLSIIREGDKEVPLRSAGAEQIVALALIGALNKNAVRRGPVIMDTPFGRLDRVHRSNVLKFIPMMADQVILLVHGGEMDREADVGLISKYINSEYDIKRTSATRSAITKVATPVGEI